MACAVCENGWLSSSDRPKACRPCHRRTKKVQAYAETLASMMGLTDWTIEVLLDSPADDAMAEIDCVYGQRLGRVALSDTWESYDLKTQRDTLVHELVHATLAPYSQMANDILAASGADLATVGSVALRNVEEWVVDSIALAWAQHLPLPEEGK